MTDVTSQPIQLLVAGLLLAAPAAVGISAVSDDVTVPVLESPQAAEGDAEVVETYEKSFDSSLSTGELDLRIDRGHVKVVGWQKNAYKVQVIQTPTDDDRTTVDFQDNSGDDHLNLSVVVDRDEDTGARVSVGPVDQGSDVPEKAIVAHVPASLDYERVHACEGEGHAISQAFDDVAERLPMVTEEDDHDVCVPADDETTSGGHVIVGTHNRSDLDVTGGFVNLHGATLEATTDNHAYEIDRIDFQSATIVSDDGDVAATNVTTNALKVHSDNGLVAFDGSLGELEATTDDGDLALSGDAGPSDIHSDNGEVSIDAQLGDLNLSTDDGDVAVRGSVGEADLDTDNGDLSLDGVEFASLDVVTDDGDVSGDNLTMDGLSADTDNGDVDLEGEFGAVNATSDDGDLLFDGDLDSAAIDSDNGRIHVAGTLDGGDIATDDGDVTLAITPEDSGRLDLNSDNGEVQVAVPEAPAFGYDVIAGSQNGDITIGLNETQETTDGDLAEEFENYKHERTHDYEDRDIQLELVSTTDDGDILVTNDAADLEQGTSGSDDGSSSRGSRTALGAFS